MNESRQTVETDTLWLSNIRALNFRKPGHLRKYCNNKKFPDLRYMASMAELTLHLAHYCQFVPSILCKFTVEG